MEKPNLDELVEVLRPSFPSLDRDGQKVSVEIYRLLAQGQPVVRGQLADRVQMPLATVNEMLGRWWGIDYDDRNRIAGYWGLTIRPTQHRLEVNGQTLYAWCAWDTLFIPEILKASACIESASPATKTTVRLKLSPEGVQEVEPVGAVMSFVTPETAKVKQNVVAHFCHFVYFFESMDAGMAWTSKQPGTFLLSIDDAYALGRKINAAQYPDVSYNHAPETQTPP